MLKRSYTELWKIFAKMKMAFYFVLLFLTSYSFRSVNSDCLYDLYLHTYAGNVSVTNNGLTCQAWSSQTPHAHTLFPQGSVTEASNFCRDVHGGGRPGCYTTNPAIDWEYCTFSICTGLSQKCGHKLRKHKGTLVPPDSDRDGIHDPYFDCRWTVEADEDQVIQYEFSILSPEVCYSQFIRVTEILEGSPKNWVIWCRQSDLVVSGETVNNVLFVWLYSDDGVQSTSLSFTFQVVKATNKRFREFLQGTSGWISAPDFDGDGLYEHNLNCMWLVEADADYFIFQLLYVEMEWVDHYCRKDSLEIWDEVGSIMRLCGKYDNQIHLKTRTSQLAVYFLSDTIVNDKGFNLTYQAVINSTDSESVTDCLDKLMSSRYAGNVSVTNNGHTCQSWSSQTPHRHHRSIDEFFPIDGSVKNASNFCRDFDGSAMGRPWCYTTNPNIFWEYCTFSICSGVERQKCGGVLEIPDGYVTPPSSTVDNYENYNADCLWIIQVPENYVIRYQVNYVEIPYDVCKNYWLLVLYDGNSLADEVKALCDLAYLGQEGETTSTSLYVHFYADNNIKLLDFNITFRAIEVSERDCIVALDDSSGWISSPDFDGDNYYDFNLDCLWHIKAPDQSTTVIQPLYIKLVQTLDVEGICILDYILVEDELGERGRYCGYHNGTIPTFESRKFSLVVRFYSDNFLTAPGFNITYYTYKKPVDCLDELTSSVYLGTVSVTNHGYTCRPWDNKMPHQGLGDEDFIHDGGIEEAKNYCRSLEKNTKPWCATTDPLVPYDLCTFSICYGQTQACEERLLNKTGWITAPDIDGDGLYDLNVDCLWRIEAPIGFRILFRLIYLDIEETISCSKDHLQIIDITNSIFQNIFLCGFSRKPFTGESNTHMMFVEFYSDNNHQYTGFDMSYNMAEETNKRCQKNTNIREKSGWLSAPDFDGDGEYDHNLNCRWTVEAEMNYVVAAQLEIDIQDSKACSRDYLRILDADFIVGTYCGVVDQMTIETKSVFLNVYFRSDAFKAAPGFNLTYQQIQRPYSCWDHLIAVPYNGTVAVTNTGQTCQPWSSQTPHSQSDNTDDLFPVDGSVAEAKNYCRDIGRTGKPWCYTIDPDIRWGHCTLVICKDKLEDCGGTLETETGIIISPDSDGDGHYDLNVDCLWIIKASKSRIIRYSLLGVSIPESLSKECIYDVLWIYERAALHRHVICGKRSQEDGETVSNVLYVHFYSNQHDDCPVKNCGFGIAFHHTEGSSNEHCRETLTSSSGWISPPDRDGDGMYDFNLNCYWIVKVDYQMSISFQILDLHTIDGASCTYDFLSIYELLRGIEAISDCNCLDVKNSFGTHCGGLFETSEVMVTHSNNLHVHFTTDGLYSSKGFNITFTEIKRQTCGAVLKKQTGWIQSPDRNEDGLYDNNAVCGWKIWANDNHSIELDIIFIRIESSPGCSYDMLWIDGATFCEEYGRQATMKMANNPVIVIFKSDFSNNDAGFLINYRNVEATPAASKILLSSVSGEIKIPQKEDLEYYDHNLYTTWHINAEQGKIIVFNLLYMDIELVFSACTTDKLLISTSSWFHQLCGQDSKLLFASHSNIIAAFLSDNSVNGLGFAATYTQLEGEVRICRDNLILTSPSQYISQTGNSIITTDCRWTIMLERNKVIIFQVLEMYITECERTIFRVNEDHLQAKTYCGDTTYDSFTTEYNKLNLLYRPYVLSDSNGFKVVYYQAEDDWDCSSEYKCLLADRSVPRHYLCDGYSDCPNGDDERFCNFRCPSGCTCLGLIVDCSGKMTPCNFDSNTTSGPRRNITLSASIRSLDVGRNPDLFRRLKLEQRNLHFLDHLNISFCNISYLPKDLFLSMSKLTLLDISYNKIKRLPSRIFSPLSELNTFFLEGNSELLILDSECFYGLFSLNHLNLIELHIKHISENAFSSLQLKELKIYSSVIDEVDQHFLANLLSESFYFNSSKIKTFTREMFQGIFDVRMFVTDEYKFCCVRPTYIPEDSCYPHKGELSFCDDLVGTEYLRPVIWLIALFIVLGNGATIVYRLLHHKTQSKHCYSIFVSNLAFSDFFMGIYLIIIAVADTSYRGQYIFNDEAWRANPLCNLAGILATLSSEASLIFICLITVDRFLVIKYPFGQRRLSMRVGTIITIVAWFFAVLVAVIPEAFYKGTFYSQSGFCIALPITRVRGPGWIFAFCLFVVVNTVCCLFVALGQWYIFKELKTSKKSVGGSRSKNRKDARVAWNLLLVAVTDFLCWIPVGTLSFWALMGNAVSVDIYNWIVVVIFPMNSAINPTLYSFSTMIQQRKLKRSSTKQQREKPANIIYTDQLEKCLSIFQNPGYRQTADEVDGYKTLTDVALEGQGWFGNPQRILVAIRIVKFLCETHTIRLRLTRFTTDDILVKRTDIKSHTILLVQPNSRPDTRTYSDYESLNECLEGICKIYEEHLKRQNPDCPSITYDISQLFDFIDQLNDLSCLVFQKNLGTYVPHNKDWLKEKIYIMLRKQAGR